MSTPLSRLKDVTRKGKGVQDLPAPITQDRSNRTNSLDSLSCKVAPRQSRGHRRGATSHDKSTMPKYVHPMSAKARASQQQEHELRAAKLAKKDAIPTTAIGKFARELRDPKRRRLSTQYFQESQEYVYAVVLKKATLKVHVEVALRLTKAKLDLCFLEPDEEHYPGVQCILVKVNNL